MKKKITQLKIILILVSLFLISSNIKAQDNFGFGAYVGGGVLSGNSPNVGCFSTSIFFDIKTPLSDNIIPRLSFIYTRDINYILPGTRFGYYPYLQGYSLKLVTSQPMSGNLFIEEGAGFASIADKTFSDSESWDYGVLFSISAGLDLRQDNRSGFKIGIGTEYGITFNNTLAKYFSLHFQAEYVF